MRRKPEKIGSPESNTRYKVEESLASNETPFTQGSLRPFERSRGRAIAWNRRAQATAGGKTDRDSSTRPDVFRWRQAGVKGYRSVATQRHGPSTIVESHQRKRRVEHKLRRMRYDLYPHGGDVAHYPRLKSRTRTFYNSRSPRTTGKSFRK